MSLTTMYPAIAYSPTTILTQDIGPADTTIHIADASVLPPAPNIATIGTDENAETILYAVKADGLLSGCTRGVEGTAQAWLTNEVVARNFTALDYETLKSNITALDNDKQNKGDYATNTKAAELAETAKNTAIQTAADDAAAKTAAALSAAKTYADEAILLKDTATGTRYKWGVADGVVYVEEVQ